MCTVLGIVVGNLNKGELKMYVKAKTTEEKLIDLVRELAEHLEDVYIQSDFDENGYGQKLCDRANKFADKSDKRRNEIYEQAGD